MKKFLMFSIGITGFILIAAISGLMAYYTFPEDVESPTEAEHVGAVVSVGRTEGEAPASPESPSSDQTMPQQTGSLTIITPALDKTKTIVRCGSFSDLELLRNPHETESETSAAAETAVEEETEKPTQKAETSKESKEKETQKETEKSVQKHEEQKEKEAQTEAETKKTEETKESETTAPVTETQPQQSQPQKIETPQQQQLQNQQQQTPDVNPDVQLSDDGL